IPEPELLAMLAGCGYRPYVVAGDDPASMHQRMAATLDRVLDDVAAIQRQARAEGGAAAERPTWPMIVLRTPKGWTGPKVVDGQQVEGTFRSHQVPIDAARGNPEHLAALEMWMRSYRPRELFDELGAPVPELRALPPA